jgi:hypothetical protein
MLLFMIECDGKIYKTSIFSYRFLSYQPSPEVFRWYEGSSKDSNIDIGISHIVSYCPWCMQLFQELQNIFLPM